MGCRRGARQGRGGTTHSRGEGKRDNHTGSNTHVYAPGLYRQYHRQRLLLTSRSLARFVAFASAVLAVLMSGWLAVMHVRMILSPAPQEMREGASVWITRLLLEGRNPYALEELPAGTNVYGIFYYLAVQPFARLLGNGYGVHRALSALGIAGACVLLYRVLRQRDVDRVLALTGTLLFYASCLYFVAPVARPDGLGMLLAMLSITFLFRRDVTTIGLAAGLVAGVLALLTKPYLAYPPFVMAAYLVLSGSIGRGLIYGTLVVAASAGALLAATRIYPAYVSLTIVANGQDTAYNLSHMVAQTGDWLVFSLPLTVALFLAAGLLNRPNAPHVDRPRRIDPFAFGAAANALVFACLLGGHPGAHMTYLFQLVTPMLLPAVFPVVGRHVWPRAAVALCLPAALWLSAPYFPLSFDRFTAAERTFARVGAAIEAHGQVLGSTEVAGLLALGGRPVVDSGQSEYFWHAASETRLPAVVPAEALSARWDTFVDDVVGGIAAERFDLVVRSRRRGLIPLDLVEKHYRRVGSFAIDFAWAGQEWPLDLWVPQHR